MVQFQLVMSWAVNWDDVLARLDTTKFIAIAQSTTLSGRLAFAGVFALLIVWLILVPGSRLAESTEPTAWWRNVRIWAIVIAASQLLVYLLWV